MRSSVPLLYAGLTAITKTLEDLLKHRLVYGNTAMS